MIHSFLRKSVLGKSVAVALAASAGLGLSTFAAPASAHGSHRYSGKQARISAHHAAIRRQAYRAGYDRGWREGHLAAAAGPVVTGRSAYVAPAVVAPGLYGGPFENGGLLGTGLLDGDGLLGTGVLSGRGALGVGILGF